MAGVIGEDELSPADKLLLEFGKKFDQVFINQGYSANRSIEQTLDLGWDLLSMLPRESLDRISDDMLDKYYHGAHNEDSEAEK